MSGSAGHSGSDTTGHGSVLTAAELALLRAVQDRLLPGDGTTPAAGDTGAAEAVDRYLTEQPALRPALLGALARIDVAASSAGTGASGSTGGFAGLDDAARDAVLRSVEAAAPDEFDALLVQTYTGYYCDPAVQVALGLPSPLQPTGYPAMMAAPFDERRLDRVRAEARPWRPV
jgi:hypothetical protein